MKSRIYRNSVFLILALTFVFSGTRSFALPAGESVYGGILVPMADPARQPMVSGYLLTLPAGGAGQVAVPVSRRVTASLYGGVFGYPAGFFGSAFLRGHILRPDSIRWGVAIQAQSGAAVAFSGGEGEGGIVNGIAIVASSPMKRTRVNFGAALHTMPGSEYQTGWKNSKEYDFKTPSLHFLSQADALSGGARSLPSCYG